MQPMHPMKIELTVRLVHDTASPTWRLLECNGDAPMMGSVIKSTVVIPVQQGDYPADLWPPKAGDRFDVTMDLSGARRP